MGDFYSPYILTTPPPPPPPSTRSNLPMLYYGLVVVGTAVVVLTVYNIIVIKWCSQRPPRRTNRFVEVTSAARRSFENPNRNLLSSFKYKKDVVGQEQGNEFECAVCLSVFEDGDEVRQLPRCKHSFHVSCIDMWLYSHSDCPLCRAPATPPLAHHRLPASTPENSREGLLDSSMTV